MVYKKHIELEKAKLSLIEEGLTLLVFKDNVNFELEDALEVDEFTYDFTEGGNFVTLVDARNIRSSITHEARDFFAKDGKSSPFRKGQAIVVNNLHIKLLANFYMKFHKPEDPVKIFRDYNKAEKWIREIRSKWFK